MGNTVELRYGVPGLELPSRRMGTLYKESFLVILQPHNPPSQTQSLSLLYLERQSVAAARLINILASSSSPSVLGKLRCRAQIFSDVTAL